MYSWQNEQGEWHFSLLGGTNRLKTKEEITGSPFGVKEIKANLCHLSLQDQVVWMNLSVDDGNPQLAFPPDSIMKEIQETAQDCDINLRVVKK